MALLDPRDLCLVLLARCVGQQAERIASLEQDIAALQCDNAALQQQKQALEQSLKRLQAQLAQDSSNSSRPPSSDPPSAPPRPKRDPSGRRRGGQPGHPKHERRLLPPERVTEVIELKPSSCRRCGGELQGQDASPHRHQVIDIPKVVATAVEYRQHSLCCARCGITTQAELPKGVPRTMVGPRLGAMVSVCSGAYRMSKRMIEEMARDFFGAELSLGTIANVEQCTSLALAEPVAQVHQAIQQAPVVNADETSWREGNKKAWLWVAATATLAVFVIRPSRGAKVAKELLGELFAGLLISDRWSGYHWVCKLRRQLCWAHLKRHFKALENHGEEAKGVGLALQEKTGELFGMWHRVRDGTLSRVEFQTKVVPLQESIIDLLRQGTCVPSKKVAGMCRDILKWKESLWTFVRREGVEPTNNHGERVLRHAVVWRKVSYGTASEAGSRFVERMLTTVQTLRLQDRNVLDYVAAAWEAKLRGQPAPSLLPDAKESQAAA